MRQMRAGCIGMAAALALGATAALATDLVEIPTWDGYIDTAQTKYFTGASTDGRGVSPDGQAVIGHSYGTLGDGSTYSIGFVWDATHGTRMIVAEAAWGFTTATGLTSRTVGGAAQWIVQGMSSGHISYATSTDGGVTWLKGYRNSAAASGVATPGTSNTVNALGQDDVFYGVWLDDTTSDDGLNLEKGSGSPITDVRDKKNVPAKYKCSVQGCSGNGIAVGRRKDDSGNYQIYVGQWLGTGTGAWGFINGLEPNAVLDPVWPADYTTRGEAWAISADGTKIFGISPIVNAGTDLYPFRMIVTPQPAAKPLQVSIKQLPLCEGTGGSTSLGWVYGCTPEGDWAVGQNYRGVTHAVLWDLTNPDSNQWTVTDLNDLFAANMGDFTRLDKAYSIRIGADGTKYVTGVGTTTSLTTRAFLARIDDNPPEPLGSCVEVGFGYRACRRTTEPQCQTSDPAHTVTWTEGATCATFTPCAIPWADADSDGDVDSMDFGFFQSCFTGTLTTPVTLEGPCACLDRVQDVGAGVIDIDDLQAFMNCVTGPAIPYSVALPPDCIPGDGQLP